MLLVDHLIHPEGQDVILQHIPHLQFQIFDFFVHFVVFLSRKEEGRRRKEKGEMFCDTVNRWS